MANQPWYNTKGGIAGISGLASGILSGLLGADVPEALAYGTMGASKGLETNVDNMRYNQEQARKEEELAMRKAQQKQMQDILNQRFEIFKQSQMQDILNSQEQAKQREIAGVQRAVLNGMLTADAGNKYLQGLGIDTYQMQQPQNKETATQPRLQAMNLGNRQVLVNPLTGEEVKSFDVAQNTPNAQNVMPSSVREWNFYNSLKTPEEKQQYLSLKRSSQIMNLGGEQAVYDPLSGGIKEFFAVTPKPEQMPQFKGEQSYSEERGKQQAKKESEIATAKRQSERQTSVIDNLISEVKNSKGIISPYAPVKEKLGQYTGGVLGYSPEQLAERGKILRAVGQVQNDLLQKARSSGQTGINTLSEINQAIKGIDENSSPEQLIGALNYMKDIEQRLNNIPKQTTGTNAEQPLTVGRFKIRIKQ